MCLNCSKEVKGSHSQWVYQEETPFRLLNIVKIFIMWGTDTSNKKLGAKILIKCLCKRAARATALSVRHAWLIWLCCVYFQRTCCQINE